MDTTNAQLVPEPDPLSGIFLDTRPDSVLKFIGWRATPNIGHYLIFRVFSDMTGYNNTTTILGSGWLLEKTLIFGSLPPKREMIFNIYLRKKDTQKYLII